MLPDTVFLSKLILRKAGGEKWNFLNTDPRVSPAAVSTNTSISSNLIAGIWTARGQKNKRHFPNTNLLKRKNSIYALPACYCFTEQLGLHFSSNTGLSDPGNPHHWAHFNTARSSDRQVTGGNYDDLGIGMPLYPNRPLAGLLLRFERRETCRGWQKVHCEVKIFPFNRVGMDMGRRHINPYIKPCN